jgi:hypothetical protein
MKQNGVSRSSVAVAVVLVLREIPTSMEKE